MTVGLHLLVQLLVLSFEEEDERDRDDNARCSHRHTKPETKGIVWRLVAQVGVGSGDR